MDRKYDIILQNNASKEFFLYSGQTDISENHLYHTFDIDLDIPEGEYTYAVLLNNRDDVEYDFKTPLLSTTVSTSQGKLDLRELQPGTGLLRIGKTIEQEAIYDEKNNNEIFYYNN